MSRCEFHRLHTHTRHYYWPAVNSTWSIWPLYNDKTITRGKHGLRPFLSCCDKPWILCWRSIQSTVSCGKSKNSFFEQKVASQHTVCKKSYLNLECNVEWYCAFCNCFPLQGHKPRWQRPHMWAVFLPQINCFSWETQVPISAELQNQENQVKNSQKMQYTEWSSWLSNLQQKKNWWKKFCRHARA